MPTKDQIKNQLKGFTTEEKEWAVEVLNELADPITTMTFSFAVTGNADTINAISNRIQNFAADNPGTVSNYVETR